MCSWERSSALLRATNFSNLVNLDNNACIVAYLVILETIRFWNLQSFKQLFTRNYTYNVTPSSFFLVSTEVRIVVLWLRRTY